MTGWARLSALDASFLHIEKPTAPMHVGAVLVFDGPVPDRLPDYIDLVIAHDPRYRQRLARVPVLGHPVWIDDDAFRLDRHIVWTEARDGGLDDLASRVFSAPLPRDRPLWQLHIVRGLADGAFAVIAKIHHAMLDGIAGAAFLAALLRATPDDALSPPAAREAEPAPGRLWLLGAELAHRAAGSRAIARAALHRTRADRAEALRAARTTASGMVTSLRDALTSASPSPLNPRAIGPARAFRRCSFPLDEIKGIKRALGGTVNDVALAIATGGLRRYLTRAGVDPAALRDFRAMLPVNIRAAGDRGMGNQVAMMLAPLPLYEPDVARRLARVHEQTERLKHETAQVATSRLLQQLADVTVPRMVGDTINAAIHRRAYNVVLTNVPGPPFPLYMLGRRLREIHALVPLYVNQGVGFALFGYAGAIHWAINADPATVPDVDRLVDDLRAAFEELRAAAQLCQTAGGWRANAAISP